jgi:tetratricopeptide (TPR) repeat protein
MNRLLISAIFLVLTTSPLLWAQGPPPPPMNVKEVIALLKSKQSHEQSVKIVMARGVDFELTPEIEKQLRKAKADDPFIQMVKESGPSERLARGGAPPIPPEEGRAILAIQDELDPDRKIQLVKEFEEKYPQSRLLTYAYSFAATAYQQKGDAPQIIAYGDKSLKLKSDNLMALIVMASILPQPQMLRGSESEKEKNLAQAETYANEALKLIADLPRKPGESDADLQKRKAQLNTEPHAALGMVHLERSSMGLEGPDKAELAKAEQEFEMATSTSSQPDAQDYYRLGEARSLEGKYDGAIEAFTKAAELGQGTVVKTLAEQRIDEIKKNRPASK